jgi:hypothetical protein
MLMGYLLDQYQGKQTSVRVNKCPRTQFKPFSAEKLINIFGIA